MKTPKLLAPLLCAALLTLANLPKPLVIDDTAYWHYARHIAEHPLDPYGFRFCWYTYESAAFDVLAPPAFLYYWAAGIRLLGDDPILWKLWLAPIAAMLCLSVHSLARRLARGVEGPVVAMTALGPAVLPGFNLMLDVPSLALGLASLAVFASAADRRTRGGPGRRVLLAALAGLLAGLAMETKYTGFTTPAAVLLYGVVFGLAARRRGWRAVLAPPALALLSAGVAAGLFVGVEALLAAKYGESHFLLQLRYQGDPNLTLSERLSEKLKLLGPLAGQLGGLTPGVTLLALVATRGCGWGWRAAGLAAGLVLLVTGYAALALVPWGRDVFIKDAAGNERLSVNSLVMALWAVGLLVTWAAVALQLLWRAVRGRRRWRLRWSAADWFVSLWLLGEVLAMFALTTFPAARRTYGVTVAATFLAARLAALTCRTAARRQLVRAAAGVGVALGAIYAFVDYRVALVEPTGVETAADFLRDHAEPGARVWYVGHWGWQFYAERAGWSPVLADQSELREGDWLVWPDYPPRPHGQALKHEPDAHGEPVRDVRVEDTLPVATAPWYYGGAQPMIHWEGPSLTAKVYRVRRDWRPTAGE